jgi:hypothetical protein
MSELPHTPQDRAEHPELGWLALDQDYDAHSEQADTYQQPPDLQERTLQPHESVRIAPNSNPSEAADVDFGGGATLHGEQVATLRMGNGEEYAEAYIVDTRSNPVVRTRTLSDGTQVPVRQVGQRSDGSPWKIMGDYMVVIPSKKENEPPEIRAITPDDALVVGRGGPYYGRQSGERHNSDDHGIIAVDKSGQLSITQFSNESNKTSLLVEERHAVSSSQEAQDNPGVQNPGPEAPKPLISEAPTGPIIVEQAPQRETSGETLSTQEALEMLSYSDIYANDREARRAHIENALKNPNTMKYVAELQQLVREKGRAELEADADDIRGRYGKFKGQISNSGLDIYRGYEDSRSWAMWDMAKQSYLSKHPEESSGAYKDANGNVASPFGGDTAAWNKRDEIALRHLGWEVSRIYDGLGSATAQALEGGYDPSGTRPKIADMLRQRNEKGQVPSHVLTRIGAQAVENGNLMRKRNAFYRRGEG